MYALASPSRAKYIEAWYSRNRRRRVERSCQKRERARGRFRVSSYELLKTSRELLRVLNPREKDGTSARALAARRVINDVIPDTISYIANVRKRRNVLYALSQPLVN